MRAKCTIVNTCALKSGYNSGLEALSNILFQFLTKDVVGNICLTILLTKKLENTK